MSMLDDYDAQHQKELEAHMRAVGLLEPAPPKTLTKELWEAVNDLVSKQQQDTEELFRQLNSMQAQINRLDRNLYDHCNQHERAETISRTFSGQGKYFNPGVPVTAVTGYYSTSSVQSWTP
jgi:small-conductance mechanosensitive channel